MVGSTWTKVEATWDIERVRKEAGRLILDYKMAIWLALRDQPDVLEKLQGVLYSEFVGQLKEAGVTTPIDLVKYLADLTVNLVGGSVSITGNAREASIAFDYLPGWDKMKDKFDISSPEEKEKVMAVYRDSLDRFCDLLGLKFTAEVEASFDCPIARITFRTI